MERIKIVLPGTFHFETRIPVRITDINYGNHVGNDSVLSIMHEARMQYLSSMGFTELDFAGVGMIMSDVAIEFKKEIFYGDIIIVSIVAAGISGIGFELYYKLETDTNTGSKNVVAIAKTGMICYDYTRKKVVAIPDPARQKLSGTK